MSCLLLFCAVFFIFIFYKNPDFLRHLTHFWMWDPDIAQIVACSWRQCYLKSLPHPVHSEPVTPASSEPRPDSIQPASFLLALQSIRLGFMCLQPFCPELATPPTACPDPACPEQANSLPACPEPATPLTSCLKSFKPLMTCSRSHLDNLSMVLAWPNHFYRI